MLRRKLDQYCESTSPGKNPQQLDILKLYQEAGINFGDAVKKTLDETQIFHSEVIKNRANFLKAEICEIESVLGRNNTSIERLSTERADAMVLLQSHGALEDYNTLHSVLLEKSALLNDTKLKISEIKSMAEKKKAIKAKRVELDSYILRDFEESRKSWEIAVTSSMKIH